MNKSIPKPPKGEATEPTICKPIGMIYQNEAYKFYGRHIIDSLVKNGELTFERVGNMKYYLVDDIDKALEKRVK